MIVIQLLASLTCIILGYLIAIKQKRFLIAGWDETKASNPEAYAKLVGGGVFFQGIGFCLISIGVGFGLNELLMFFVILVVCIIPIPCLMIAGNKYGKKKTPVSEIED